MKLCLFLKNAENQVWNSFMPKVVVFLEFTFRIWVNNSASRIQQESNLSKVWSNKLPLEKKVLLNCLMVSNIHIKMETMLLSNMLKEWKRRLS